MRLAVDVEEVERHRDRPLLAGLEFDRHPRRVGEEGEPDHLALEPEVAHRLWLVAGVRHHHHEFGLLGGQRQRAGRVGLVERDAVDGGIDLDHVTAVGTAGAEQEGRREHGDDRAVRANWSGSPDACCDW